MEDALAEAGGDFVDQGEDVVCEAVAFDVPAGAFGGPGRVLDEERGDVSAGRREAVVEGGRERELDHGALGKATGDGGLVGGVELVEAARAEVDGADVVGALRFSAARREDGEAVEGEVDLGDGAPHVDGADVAGELHGEEGRVDELEEGALGVGVREHEVRLDLAAIPEDDAPGAAPIDADALHRALDLEGRAGCAGGGRQGVGESAHAAPHVGPDTASAVDLAHHVVEEDVAGAGCGGGGPGTDDGVGRQGGEQGLALEPALEGGSGGAEEQRRSPRDVPAKPQESPGQAGQRREVARMEARGIRGRRVEEGLDGLRQALQQGLVARPGGGRRGARSARSRVRWPRGPGPAGGPDRPGAE